MQEVEYQDASSFCLHSVSCSRSVARHEGVVRRLRRAGGEMEVRLDCDKLGKVQTREWTRWVCVAIEEQVRMEEQRMGAGGGSVLVRPKAAGA